MSKTLLLLALVLVTLTGCQALTQQPAAPTPTPVLLPAQTAPASSAVQATTATAAATQEAKPSSPPTPAATPEPAPGQAPVQALTQAVESGAPPRLLALGLRATVTLRSAAEPNAPIIAQHRGSDTLWAEGRSADGKWLWVSYGDGESYGWLGVGEVKVFGDASALPVVAQTATAPTAAAATTAKVAVAPAAPAQRLAGKIAFQTGSGGDIYLVNADGTGLRRIAAGLDPTLSPDGTRLAYARWGDPAGVYVLDLRSGAEQRVAAGNKPRSPAWNAAGTQLAFTHVAKFIDCRQTPLGCFSDAEIRDWLGGEDCADTPNGRTCIDDFPLIQAQESGIARVNADGGGWQDLSGMADTQALSWHPRRDELLFRSGAGLYATSPDAAPWQLLKDGSLGSPSWSPDGGRIVVQKHLHDHTDIFLLDASGKTLQRLTTPPAGATKAPNNVAPAWSPDGKSLLFLSDREGAWRLYRMNADGTGQVLFLPNPLKSIAFRYDFASERMVSWAK